MVNAAQIGQLTRLHQRGVDGAGEQLRALLQRAPVEFGRAVGLERHQLESVHSANELVRAITDARRRRRERGHRGRIGEARQHARELACHAEFGADGVRLDPALLQRVVARPTNAMLVFDVDEFRGGISMALLYRAFRACRSVKMEAALVREGILHLHYETQYGSGLYRLVLQPVRPEDEVVVVPLVTPPPDEGGLRVPPPSTASEPARPSFWDMMVDALVRTA